MSDNAMIANDWAEEVADMDNASLINEASEVEENGFAPEGWREALDAELRKRGL